MRATTARLASLCGTSPHALPFAFPPNHMAWLLMLCPAWNVLMAGCLSELSFYLHRFLHPFTPCKPSHTPSVPCSLSNIWPPFSLVEISLKGYYRARDAARDVLSTKEVVGSIPSAGRKEGVGGGRVVITGHGRNQR